MCSESGESKVCKSPAKQIRIVKIAGKLSKIELTVKNRTARECIVVV